MDFLFSSGQSDGPLPVGLCAADCNRALKPNDTEYCLFTFLCLSDIIARPAFLPYI